MGKEQKEMNELEALLEQYSYNYHTLDQPLVSDYEYDQKIKKLIELQKLFPDYKVDNSITERVGNVIISKFQKKTHDQKMLSLDNAFSLEDLQNFDSKIQKALGDVVYSYIIELKIDGIAISLKYDPKLEVAVTRGDGTIGEDVTHNIQTIKELNLEMDEKIEVRGEVYISKENFNKINSEQEVKFANPRNLAAGTVRQLESKVAQVRKLSIFVYGLIDYKKLNHNSYLESMNYLKSKGFPINQELKVLSNIEEVYNQVKRIEKDRNNYPYEIDGVVVKVNEYQNQEKLGTTNKFPKWAIAYKFESIEVKTKLLDIIYTIGRTGKIIPNAVLEPIDLMGSKISRATLHNFDYIKTKDIRVGDDVVVIKAGDIIPKVKEVVDLKSKQHKQLEPTVFIQKCPKCGEELIYKQKEYLCTNIECPGILAEKIIYFISKNGLDIQGLGGSIVYKLIEQGIVKDITDIFDLTYQKIELIEGFADKSILNLLEAITQAKKTELSIFLTALGIPHAGKETIKIITKKYQTIEEILNLSEQEYLELDGIGPKTATSIISFFQKQKNSENIQQLLEKGFELKNSDFLDPEEEKLLLLNHKTFVITGSFENYKRDQIKKQIELLGGKVTSTVSKQTTGLICGTKAGSKLSKAKMLAIPIILEPKLELLLKGDDEEA